MDDEVTLIDFYHIEAPPNVEQVLPEVFDDLEYSDIDGDDPFTTTYGEVGVMVDLYVDDPERGELSLLIHVGGIPWRWNARDDETYRAQMSSIFELICELTTRLNPDYVSLYETERRGMDVIPEDRHIDNGIERPPVIGVYSETALELLGGLEGLFEDPPYYTAELPSGHTVVVDSADPWQRRGWSPPTDAEYIAPAMLGESFSDDPTDSRSGDLTDPFAAMSAGEYGTDVCIDPEDADAEFANDTLHLLSVRVDSAGNLRRRSDDPFVRNVVTEAFDDRRETIAAMLSEVPAEVASDNQMVSALLHDAIPPEFVRMDDPDSETVVSKVMDLDVETNKIDLLVALGRAVQGSDRDDDEAVSVVDEALETLSTVEDLDGDVDAWLRQNVL